MIVYCVPNTGIHGGIKVAYHFVDAVRAAGAAACIATPDGRASTWFRSTAPVAREADMLRRLRPGDVVLFSLPSDYGRLKAAGHRLVFHCQGTDPAIAPILRDPTVMVLTCWSQAADHVRARGREPVDVGIAIPDAFAHRGEARDLRTALHMPRRGADVALEIAEANPQLVLSPIDGLDEEEVAARMRRAGVYLATAADEWFGLPALEAMAAGCLVFSLPVVGGMEYLHDGVNCHVGPTAALRARIAEVLEPEHAARWDVMRHAAMATAARYRPSAQQALIAAFVERLGPAAAAPLSRAA